MKSKVDKILQTRSESQKSLSSVQADISAKLSTGGINFSKYMAYMQMVTFSFNPKSRKR
jgi:hypothetical protein